MVTDTNMILQAFKNNFEGFLEPRDVPKEMLKQPPPRLSLRVVNKYGISLPHAFTDKAKSICDQLATTIATVNKRALRLRNLLAVEPKPILLVYVLTQDDYTPLPTDHVAIEAIAKLVREKYPQHVINVLVVEYADENLHYISKPAHPNLYYVRGPFNMPWQTIMAGDYTGYPVYDKLFEQIKLIH